MANIKKAILMFLNNRIASFIYFHLIYRVRKYFLVSAGLTPFDVAVNSN